MKNLLFSFVIFLSISAFAAEEFEVQPYSAGRHFRAISLADYNGDGIAEVWTGDFNSPYNVEIWTYNSVIDNLEKVGEISGFSYSIHDIAVADLDGDEDMDAVVAVRSYGTYVCVNNGDSWTLSHLDNAYGWQVVLEDFDLDGNLDILAATDWSYLKVFYGDGLGGFLEGAAPPLERLNGDSKGMNVADINNDGRMDIIGLAGEWDGSGTNQYFLRAYTNTDTGSAIAWTSVGPDNYFSALPTNWNQSSPHSAGDLNKDGYTDLVDFSLDNRMYIYYGDIDGDSLIWEQTNPAIFQAPATSAVMFDIDMDTYPDIIYGGYNNFNDLHIYYNNHENWFVYDSVQTNYGIGDFHTLKAADVTGNGWPDIVASKYTTSDDGFVLYINSKAPAARKIYVNQNATGSNTGDDWENAYTNLNKALSLAGTGSELWVTKGLYLPDTIGLNNHRSASFIIPEGVSLYGGFAGTETLLEERDWDINITHLSGDIGVAEDSSDNCYHVVLGNTDARLDGFYVTDGYADGTAEESYGGAMLNDHVGSVSVANCIFEDNYAAVQGGAIANNFLNGSATIGNCSFINNSSSYGGAVDNHDTPSRMDRCLFTGNEVSIWGSSIFNWGAKSSSHITHCTFAGNLGDVGTIHNRASGISTYVINSIFWNNFSDIVLTNGAQNYVHYSRIEQAEYADINNNISGDPQFVDADAGDFHLAEGSVCIDSATVFFAVGNDTLVNADSSTYKGTAPDMGVYESNYLHLEKFYVDQNATGNNSGEDWTNALTDLNQALQSATSGNEIWVAAGVYTPDSAGTGLTPRSSSFIIPEGVSLYGGFAGTETLLEERDWDINITHLSGDIGVAEDSSDNCYHVVLGNTDARLDGFYVTDGYADGTAEESYGGAMLNDHVGSVSVANCIFEDNYAAVQGGAIANNFLNGSATIGNCSFINNSSSYGGAVDNHDTPSRMDRCLFTGNEVSIWGSSIFNWGAKSSSHITHCTFAGNLGDVGTIHNRASGISTYVINSIFWNNFSDIVLTNGAQNYVHYSRIEQAEYADINNNISGDPQFVDADAGDFHLAEGSVCIDSATVFFAVGNDTLVNADSSTYKGTAPDMGMYESNYITGISDSENKTPTSFALLQNYPNPFNPTTAISYRLSDLSLVDLSIFNVLGQKIATLVSEKQPAGKYQVNWDASGLPTGLYFFQLKAGKYSEVRKMMLLK